VQQQQQHFEIISSCVRQPEERSGVFRNAWSSVKALAGNAFRRSNTSGFSAAAFSAADVEIDDDEQAARPILPRSNRDF
jgi:hypothetical protein